MLGVTIIALGKLKETVEYWRQFIPRDGMRLSEL